MKNIKILVAYHKDFPIIGSDIYLPIHVGKDISSINLNIQCDNTGDNISYKNSIYCEMSAVYWAWKNLDADYYGLCHYRRHFTLKNNSLVHDVRENFNYWLYRILGNVIRPGISYNKTNIMFIDSDKEYENRVFEFSEHIKELLQNGDIDIILPKPWIFSCNNNGQHFFILGKYYFQLLDDVVKDLYPSLQPYLLRVYKSNSLYAANMFVLKKDLFQKYCIEIFSILKEHENRAQKLGYCIDVLKDKTYFRLSGYLAELLTNAIILKFIDEGAKSKTYSVMFHNG